MQFLVQFNLILLQGTLYKAKKQNKANVYIKIKMKLFFGAKVFLKMNKVPEEEPAFGLGDAFGLAAAVLGFAAAFLLGAIIGLSKAICLGLQLLQSFGRFNFPRTLHDHAFFIA